MSNAASGIEASGGGGDSGGKRLALPNVHMDGWFGESELMWQGELISTHYSVLYSVRSRSTFCLNDRSLGRRPEGMH